MVPDKFPITSEVIISFEDKNDRRLVLLLKNLGSLSPEEWQLPTTNIKKGETTVDAAQRVTREKVNLNMDKRRFEFLNIYDDPSRIPDGKRVISVAYFIFLEDMESILTAKNKFMVKKKFWFDVDHLPKLSFDHRQIIKEFLLQQYPIHHTLDK